MLSGHFFLDCFSGDGGVSRKIRAKGFESREFDLKWGPEGDLTDRAVIRNLCKSICAGKVLGLMLGPPCASFSVARDRTSVIRTARYPWGLPREQLSEREQSTISVGNACLVSTLRLMKACQRAAVPFVLEQPRSSKMWWIPEIQSFLRKKESNFVVCDQCQYGQPWRKATAFLCFGLSPENLVRLSKRCSGARGWCSKLNGYHRTLTGQHPQLGIPWTRLAEHYPPRLCEALAFVLTDEVRARLPTVGPPSASRPF